VAESARFRDLRLRIAELKRRLPRANPIGEYSQRQIDATLSFRLLAHAEFEGFLEDACRYVMRLDVVQFQITGRASSRMLALCSAYKGPVIGEEMTTDYDAEQRLRDAVGLHTSAILKNNGIKEANLAKLLQPLGVTTVDLDPVWVPNLNSFGSSRGDAAHNHVGSIVLPDPVQERADVTAVLAGFRDLDRLLQ
jgi:hypothetical protein